MIPRLLLITFLLVSPLANAESKDVFSERETLFRIQEQIKQLKPLIDLAQSQAHSERHHRFDYARVHHDLKVIQNGISHYLSAPLEPRKLDTDLSGDYHVSGAAK